jgi:hypothetical protein
MIASPYRIALNQDVKIFKPTLKYKFNKLYYRFLIWWFGSWRKRHERCKTCNRVFKITHNHDLFEYNIIEHRLLHLIEDGPTM